MPHGCRKEDAMNLTDILSNKDGRQIIDRIEEAEAEIKDRGIDQDDENEFWARARRSDIEELEKQFGYKWEWPYR